MTGGQTSGADSLRVDEISRLDELVSLKAEWEQLLLHSSHVSAFAAPAAVMTWFRLVAGHSGAYVLAVWDDARLVGIAPFSTTRMGSFRLLSTAGAGFGYHGEPLLGPDPEPVAQAIVDHMGELVSSGLAAFYLRRLRTDGTLLSVLGQRDDVVCQQLSGDEASSVVRFDEMSDPDQYFEDVAKKHKVPRFYRRLHERFDDVQYVVEDPEPDLALEAMRDMQRRRFETDLRMFATPQNRALTRTLARAQIESGHGRVSSLMADGERVAVAFTPHVGSQFTWYAVAYEPDLRKFGLGNIEMYEMLSNAYSSGASEVDLGDARFDYKKTWANATIDYRTLAVTGPGRRGTIANNLRRVAIRFHRARRLDHSGNTGPHVV